MVNVGVSWKSSNMSANEFKIMLNCLNFIHCLNSKRYFYNHKIDFLNLSQIENEFGILIHNFDDLDHLIILMMAALCTLDVIVLLKLQYHCSSSVGTLTKLANWRQKPWSNILYNPVTSTDIFERDFYESWENTFSKIAKDVSELTQNWSSR